MSQQAAAPSPKFLRVDGDRLLDSAGAPVVLRGVGLGGWMNMENFITGYPSTESLQRGALEKALGEEGYRRFFDRLLETFFGEEDARFLASLGMNCVRVPFNYRHFEDDARPFEIHPEGFRRLDRAVEACARHGLFTVLDLHAAQGFQNQHWHSDNPTHRAFLWTHKQFQDRVVHLWEALADHYKRNPWVAGYNLLNEPSDPTGAALGPLYRRLHDAIRKIDPEHVLFLDGDRYANDFDGLGDPLPNCVYSAHDYAPPGYVWGGRYPGITRGRHYDRAALEKTFLEKTAFMRRTKTPIWIGELGPVYTGDPAQDEERYQILRDQLAIYAEHGAGWSVWTYKDIGLQGLVYVPPGAPYLNRIAPVLEKKARLGADSWGGVDTGIRHLMEPIERTFREEFPDFDPFPFGQRSFIELLVRHILLAEPLVPEFGRCFEGLAPAEAEALAGDFRFDRCRVREGLAKALREALERPPSPP